MWPLRRSASAWQKIDDGHVCNRFTLQTPHVQADVKLFAEFCPTGDFIVLAEHFPIDFQAVLQGLIRHLPIESGFNDLEKCARSAQSL